MGKFKYYHHITNLSFFILGARSNMKTNVLKLSLFFGIMVQFLSVYSSIFIAHGTVFVEHEEMGSDPYVSFYGWFNRKNICILKGVNAK